MPSRRGRVHLVNVSRDTTTPEAIEDCKVSRIAIEKRGLNLQRHDAGARLGFGQACDA